VEVLSLGGGIAYKYRRIHPPISTNFEHKKGSDGGSEDNGGKNLKIISSKMSS
jgi:hypothetical protein